MFKSIRCAALWLMYVSCLFSAAFAQVNANFAADTQAACNAVPLSVQFSDSSTGSIVSYLWDFGNGTTSSLANPSVVYSNPGSYTVSLIVSDGSLADTIIKSDFITLGTAQPSAAFSLSDTAGCAPFQPSIFNNSTNATSYTWHFGDGTTSSSPTPSKTFANGGQYEIQLIAYNQGPACSDTFSQLLNVFPEPDASFQASINGSCEPPLSVTLSSLAPLGSIVLWQWNPGVPALPFSSRNLNVVYTAYGDFDVTLNVIDTNNCQASLTQSNFIQIQEAQADFGSDLQNGCAPLSVQFMDSTSVLDSIVSWLWVFGDGDSSTLANPSHIYQDSGQYHVKLFIETQSGCTDSILKSNYISAGMPPDSIFYLPIPDIACAIDPIVFFNLSNPLQGVNWTWDFGDGNQATGLNASYVYQDTGFFDVTLIGETQYGCRDSIVRQNVVEIVEPVASFIADSVIGCSLPFTVNFTDLSISATEWNWNFGDSSFSTQQNPSHTYTQAGTYTVTLFVENDETGCTDDFELDIRIIEPIVNFTASDLSVCQGETVNFINNSVNLSSYLSFDWSFGDGITDSQEAPSHAYSSPGLYDVQLIGLDSVGCRDTIVKSDFVLVTEVEANLVPDETSGCIDFLVNFTDSSTISPPNDSIVSWHWDFGDGSNSQSQHPSHTYTNFGYYDVSLYIESGTGCRDTILLPNLIEASGVSIDFSADEQNDCAPLSVNFSDSTQIFPATAVITQWDWDFGDGGSSNQQNPSYIYTSPGQFDVQLSVTNDFGCSDSVLFTNYIDVCTPIIPAFDCDSLTKCSVTQFGDVDTLGIQANDALVWTGAGFVGQALPTSPWTQSIDTTYIQNTRIGIGTNHPTGILELSGGNPSMSTPLLQLSGQDVNSPTGFELQIKGHPTGNGNASEHTQITTAKANSRLTIKAANDGDRAPRLQMTGAGETNNPGWAIFDYGSREFPLPEASFKMRYVPFNNSPIDMIQAKADSAVLLAPLQGKVGIGTSKPDALLHVAGSAQIDDLTGGGSVYADANGRLMIGSDQTEDADADSTNELIQQVNLNGSTLEISDAGNQFSVDLSSLSSAAVDNDWQFSGATSLNDPIYRTGAVGIGLIAPIAQLQVTNGSVLFNGSVGATPVSGAGSRMMWIPQKAAFRAGSVTASQWDDANIGLYSVGFGLSTQAPGLAAVAMGQETQALARNSVAMGRNSQALAEGATAIGRDVVASAEGSVAMGYSSLASGFAATAMGLATDASGDYSVAFGSGGQASGFASTALGLSTEAAGSYAMATGLSNTASFAALALGRNNLDTGSNTAWVASDFVMTIGDGTDDNLNRSNCLSVKKNGDLWIQGSLTQFSDRRLKQDIQALDGVMAKLQQINGVSYEWKEQAKMGKDREIGVIAQELEAVYPELVEEVEGYKAVNYIGLIPVLLEAIKSQQQTIDQLVKEVDDLKENTAKPSPVSPSPTTTSSQASAKTTAQLFQNQPNPFSQSTRIPFFLPEEVEEVEIRVFELHSGRLLRAEAIETKGYGEMYFDSSHLAAGVYGYSLWINGELIETRRLTIID